METEHVETLLELVQKKSSTKRCLESAVFIFAAISAAHAHHVA
jgi:hypothetical protein